jgi:hypothetical protein
MACCHDSACSSPSPPDALNGRRWQRALWIALIINAGFFVAEIAAGAAAGSTSLQADALDFFGDAGNYAISLGVAGMALTWRARAAVAKGSTLIVLALWVLASTAWRAFYGTLPQAEVMGVVGVAALIANGAWRCSSTASAPATRTCARSGFARAMMPSVTRQCCSRLWGFSAQEPAGRMWPSPRSWADWAYGADGKSSPKRAANCNRRRAGI